MSDPTGEGLSTVALHAWPRTSLGRMMLLVAVLGLDLAALAPIVRACARAWENVVAGVVLVLALDLLAWNYVACVVEARRSPRFRGMGRASRRWLLALLTLGHLVPFASCGLLLLILHAAAGATARSVGP